MKLHNGRFYFDYNATSPLSPSVKTWLQGDDFFYANASSLHSSGKLASKLIRETKMKLRQYFQLTASEHDIFFHSGATEGTNFVLQGLAKQAWYDGREHCFVLSEIDHSCAYNQVNHFKKYGQEVVILKVGEDGLIDLQQLRDLLKSHQNIVMNFIWGHNELGVIQNLEELCQIKRETPFICHVDAVQAPGKMDLSSGLFSEIDAYTFSGHKFGAFKGTGFTFINSNLKLIPLMYGGGQQQGRRPGTHNIDGILSLEKAINDLSENLNLAEAVSAREWLEHQLSDYLGDRGEVITKKFKNKLSQTIPIILKNIKIDQVLIALDLAGVDVSHGSACSSQLMKPLRSLLAIGKDQEDATNMIRLSFCPTYTTEQAKHYFEVLKDGLKPHV